MMEKRKLQGFSITLLAAVTSLFFLAPAAIVEVFSWLPKQVLAPIPSSSFFWKFIGLCEIAVAIGYRVYLFLSLIINIFLLFRRQAPVWLKVLVWVLFAVAVFGAVRVETELKRLH